MLISTARGLFRTVAAMIAPCSVKASGSLRRPPRPRFDVAFCNIKPANSSVVSAKRRSAGKRLRLRADLLVEPCGAHAVERGELGIEQHPMTADGCTIHRRPLGYALRFREAHAA